MSRILQRIEALEKVLERSSDQRGEMVRRALRHMSLDQLTVMEDMARESRDGRLGRELTEQESAARAAFQSAVEIECRSAGLSPSIVFQKSSPGSAE